jgi:uncharacterized protein (TIGR03435 family)
MRVVPLVGFIALLSASPAGQSASPVKFEVADVHPSVPVANGPPALNAAVRIGVPRNGRYEIRRATMVDLIRTAYGVEADKVVGGPHWLEMNRFDIIAKVPASANRETVMPMLQALLAERFGLVIRQEMKPVKANAIVQSGAELRLKSATSAGTCQQNISTNAAAATLTMTMTCRGTSLAGLAEQLTRSPSLAGITGPVVDASGLAGGYDFDLVFVPAVLSNTSGGQTFTQALANLGLKLEPREVPMPTITVEGVNQTPTANDAAAVAAAFPPQPPPEFDVADIKPSAPGARAAQQILPNGQLTLSAIPLRTMIGLAWNPPNAASIIGPRELDNTFDVIARMEAGSTQLDQEVLGPRLQKLLLDSLNLKVRWEEREVKGFSLVAEGKHKLVPSDPAARTRCTSTSATTSSSSGTTSSVTGIMQTLNCQNMTMGEFVAQLQRTGGAYFQVPVLDETGIDGRWNFTLSFSPPGLAQALATARATAGIAQPGGGGTASDPTGEMTIEQAVDRYMGLKLRSRQRTGRVLVVEYVPDPPTRN